MPFDCRPCSSIAYGIADRLIVSVQQAQIPYFIIGAIFQVDEIALLMRGTGSAKTRSSSTPIQCVAHNPVCPAIDHPEAVVDVDAPAGRKYRRLQNGTRLPL